MLTASTPLLMSALGAGPPAVEQRLPFGHVELELDADIGEVLLDVFVHRQRQHLARAARRDREFEPERLAGP